MFFLKELPRRRMIEGYAGQLAVNPIMIENALIMMRRASLMIRRLDAYFDREGLSQLRFLFLIVIDREEDRESLTIGEITERLDVSGPVVARTLRTLLDDGLVSKTLDKTDLRIRHVSLTPLGKERLASLMPGYFQIIAEQMKDLAP